MEEEERGEGGRTTVSSERHLVLRLPIDYQGCEHWGRGGRVRGGEGERKRGRGGEVERERWRERGGGRVSGGEGEGEMLSLRVYLTEVGIYLG